MAYRIWLFDLAQELPSDVYLDGYDISDAQFPSKELWPSNVNFALMDSFRDPPDSILESYDVVHLRMWAISVAQGKDLNTLIRSASKLLSRSRSRLLRAVSMLTYRAHEQNLVAICNGTKEISWGKKSEVRSQRSSSPRWTSFGKLPESISGMYPLEYAPFNQRLLTLIEAGVLASSRPSNQAIWTSLSTLSEASSQA